MGLSYCNQGKNRRCSDFIPEHVIVLFELSVRGRDCFGSLNKKRFESISHPPPTCGGRKNLIGHVNSDFRFLFTQYTRQTIKERICPFLPLYRRDNSRLVICLSIKPTRIYNISHFSAFVYHLYYCCTSNLACK